ncbi:hypothetical protein ZEAMMB73_Zm00001d024749 [Zea mays]|uniref:Peroxidase n=1 Tax=Zea mays TaxID=4577 RepID=K7UG68_MAIZE|nr:hypothetical protein ZEAMMB73_Zm00001d024749 [Zea mays]
MGRSTCWLMPAALLVALIAAASSSVALASPPGKLEVGFYEHSCPQAEDIVRNAVRRGIAREPGVGAGLRRLHPHQLHAGQQGREGLSGQQPQHPCAASTSSTTPRPSSRRTARAPSPAPTSSRSRPVTAPTSPAAWTTRSRLAAVMAACPKRRRCSTTMSQLRLTRSTSSSRASSARGSTPTTWSRSLARTPSAAPTAPPSRSAYNFSGQLGQTDPSLDPAYAGHLKARCPWPSSDDQMDPTVVPLDPVTPATFDNQYYKNVLAHKVLFISDNTLLDNPWTAGMVHFNAAVEKAWQVKFAKAMVKMGKVQVLTGDEGEIREKCFAVNPHY